MVGTGLIKCTERERENGTSGASLLHSCVTDFAGSPDNAPQLRELAIDRLSIAAVTIFFFFFFVTAGDGYHSGASPDQEADAFT